MKPELEAHLESPAAVARRIQHLQGLRRRLKNEHARKTRELNSLSEYLSLDKPITAALDLLSQQLFGSIAELLEKNLTLALQEILEQNIALKVTREFKNNRAAISFHIEREGQHEDILKGQGGSVANILSVGLRMFALRTLDESEHRRFLIMDEQDCWLRPDLIPRFVRIIQEAGKALGFQVLMITHHNLTSISHLADKIYEFIPTPDGVVVRESHALPKQSD